MPDGRAAAPSCPTPAANRCLSGRHPTSPLIPAPLQTRSCAQLKEEKSDAGYSKQQLILGTHTSEGEQNYLMRAEVQLPLEETETDGRCAEAGWGGAAAGPWVQGGW